LKKNKKKGKVAVSEGEPAGRSLNLRILYPALISTMFSALLTLTGEAASLDVVYITENISEISAGFKKF